MFWTKKPATIAMVVGRLAAHTPSLFNVFSSVCVATTKGGAHCDNKHYMYTKCINRAVVAVIVW